jgi:hypothetical protein
LVIAGADDDGVTTAFDIFAVDQRDEVLARFE